MSSEFMEVQRLLLRMGVTPNYAGFHYTACAVELSLERKELLVCVTKFLYPEVAKRYQTTWMAVERDIRTVILVIWKTNPSLLNEIAGCALPKRPSPGQFLGILTAHLSFSQNQQLVGAFGQADMGSRSELAET